MSRPWCAWGVAALSLSGILSPLRAQVTPSVWPGSFVRWHNWRHGSDSIVEGTVNWIRSDSLSAVVGARSVTIALAAHPDLQLRGDKGGHGLRGALIGLGVGAATGATIGYVAGASASDCFLFCVTRGQATMIYAGLFGLLGAKVGSLAGSESKWKPLRPGQVTGAVQIRPMVTWSHGPALGVSVQF